MIRKAVNTHDGFDRFGDYLLYSPQCHLRAGSKIYGLDIQKRRDKTVRVEVNTSPLFFTWLMNFGADITILSPESVKNSFVALAKKALSQYES